MGGLSSEGPRSRRGQNDPLNRWIPAAVPSTGASRLTNGTNSKALIRMPIACCCPRVAFNQDRLQIQQLTAKTGGGTLNLGGFITYGRNVTFNVTATAKVKGAAFDPSDTVYVTVVS